MNNYVIPGIAVPANVSVTENRHRPGRRKGSKLGRALLLIATSVSMLVVVGQLIQPVPLQAQSCPSQYPSEHLRLGFNFSLDDGQHLQQYEYQQLGAGWFHDYAYNSAAPGDITYSRMIRSSFDTKNLTSTIGPIVDANPGIVWFAGNEPDKDSQDNQTPDEYARFYHRIYTFIKDRDPSSQVAVAGIVQATPLRLYYLDKVLEGYEREFNESMPIDIMTVHGFILCETCGWGAGIPPGLHDDPNAPAGQTFEVSDHGNIEIFKSQIVAMRQWMTLRGFKNRPLFINEFGILMPATFEGFGYPDVRDYMRNSFDYILNATDESIGYAADGYRMVQQGAWFSLNAEPYDPETYLGFNGELFNSNSKQIKPLGLDFKSYMQAIKQQTDVQTSRLTVEPALVASDSPPSTVLVTTRIENWGNKLAYGIALTLSIKRPGTAGPSIELGQQINQLAIGPENGQTVQFEWSPQSLQTGKYDLTLKATVDACNPEFYFDNQEQQASLVVVPGDSINRVHLPLVPLEYVGRSN